MGGVRWVFAVTLIVLALPAKPAAAEPIDGVLSGGSLALVGNASLEFSPSAAYWADAEHLLVSIHAREAIVRRWEFSSIKLGPTQFATGDSSAEDPLTDVTIGIDGESGWLGFYAAGDSIWKTRSEAAVVLQPAPAGWVGNSETASTGAWASRFPAFGVESQAATLQFPISGVEVEGNIELKGYGPSFAFDAAENSSRYATGATGGNAPIYETERWFAIQAFDARVTISPRSLGVAATGKVDGHVDGILQAERGKLGLHLGETGDAAPAGPLVLAGELAFSVSAMDGRRGPVATATVSGDLRSSSANLVPRSGSTLGIPLLVVAVGSFMVGAVAVHRRRREPDLAPDESVEMALAASERGNFGSALLWTRRAIGQSATSARLRADEAYYLAELGHLDEARDAYRAASELSDEGEEDFLHAVLAARMSLGPDEVEALLIRAIERTPALVLEAEDDPCFATILARPRVQVAVMHAHAAIRREESCGE
jgi:hypothetical protein